MCVCVRACVCMCMCVSVCVCVLVYTTLHSKFRVRELRVSQSVVQFVNHLRITYSFILQYGGTALVAASKGGHLAVVQLFIDRGADVNVKDKVCHLIPVICFNIL